MSESEYRAEQLAAVAREMARLDLVNVVRCRDCKYYELHGLPSKVYPDNHWCDRLSNYLEPDGFCALAERREDG